jgi:CHASE3 domain sensor protein
VSEQESLLLMYGWIVLAVLNLILITVAFLQYAD